jgi:hypothetical protein
LTRRRLLSLIGAGVAAAPFLEPSRQALGADAPVGLQRFVSIYMPHGVARELWRPKDGFVIDYPESSLAPFDDPSTYGQSFRDRLLVVEGLDLTTGIQGGSAGHDGSRVLLTGSAGNGKNPSLDQFLSVERELGATTPLGSLVLGVGDARAGLGRSVSYAAGGSALSKLVDPRETYHQAFAQWVVGEDPAARARAELERSRGLSLLDAIGADLAALSQRVGADERWKLEQHAVSLREVEKRIGGFELGCTPPPAPDAAALPNVMDESHFDLITDLQIDLLAQALSCGVTRFATLFLADLSHTGYDSMLPSDVHADVAHRYSASSDPASDPEINAPGKPGSWSLLGRQNRYCYSKVARLLAKLAELDLLDSTLVLASSDMGDPSRHSSRSIPTVLAGGGSTFRLGRYLDVRSAGVGVPNNRLLVSIGRAFGAPLDSYGESSDPAVVQGELSGLV